MTETLNKEVPDKFCKSSSSEGGILSSYVRSFLAS